MIKAIAGCMKSGKSSEVLRKYKRAKIAGMKVQLFKPDTNKRFEEGKVVSRDDISAADCTLIPAFNASYIISVLEDGVELVIIDEVQFFAKEGNSYPIVDIVQRLADMGIEVLVCGLDMDSDRNPFGPMPYLLAIATEVKKIHAICECCHRPAMYTFANFNKESQISVEDEGSKYSALCDRCYCWIKKSKDQLYKLSPEIMDMLNKLQEKRH